MSYRDPCTQINAVEEFLKESHPGDLDVLKAIHQELIRRELIFPQFGVFQTLDMLGDHVQLLRKEKKESQTCHLSTHKGHWDIILKTKEDGSLAYEIRQGDGAWMRSANPAQ